MAQVIAQAADWRLSAALDPDGDASFALAETKAGRWATFKRFANGKALRHWLAMIALNPPAEIVAAAHRVGDDPRAVMGSQAQAVEPQDGARWAILPAGADAGARGSAYDWKSNLPPRNPAFFQASPEYHGVLYSTDAGRLIVSPNGQKYAWQTSGPSGQYSDVRWRKTLSPLLSHLPPAVAQWAASALPEHPASYNRPWAAQIERARASYLRENPAKPEYVGTIATDGAVRLVCAPGADQYWLQTQRGAGDWQLQRAAPTASGLSPAITRPGEGWPNLSRFVCRSERLADAIAACPDDPAKWCQPENPKPA